MDKALRKYLEHYAENGVGKLLADNLHARPYYGHAVIIPACAEGRGLLKTTESIPKSNHPVLIIIVLNAPTDAKQETHASNQESIEALVESYGNPSLLADGLAMRFEVPKGTLCVIDHFSKGRRLPPKQAVGLARKIGTDAALKLWSEGRILSPYLHSSDADVLFPPDLFQQVLNASPRESHSAILLPFWHEPEPDSPEIRRANALYEIKLRYYVLGLHYARSPYAHQSIGSTIAVHAHDYARVRGFPKRPAGEDFYLLNKLVKLRPLARAHGEAILIQGRCSDRVPFGTGPAITQITQSEHSDYLLYNPQCFVDLKRLLEKTNARFGSNLGLAELLAEPCDQAMLNALEGLGYRQDIEEAFRRSNNALQAQRNFHTYFDALKTLKLIHRLRDMAYPSIRFQDALGQATFIPDNANDSRDLDIIRGQLRDLENKT